MLPTSSNPKGILCSPKNLPVNPFSVASRTDRSLGLPQILKLEYRAPVFAAPDSPVKQIVTPDVDV